MISNYPLEPNMETPMLSQQVLMAYSQAGIYSKAGGFMGIRREFPKIREMLKEEGKTLESIVADKAKELGVEVPKIKMACGADSKSDAHWPIISCEYCLHKHDEASVPGFC